MSVMVLLSPHSNLEMIETEIQGKKAKMKMRLMDESIKVCFANINFTPGMEAEVVVEDGETYGVSSGVAGHSYTITAKVDARCVLFHRWMLD